VGARMDKVSKQKRSQIMSRIRSKHTKAEIILLEMLKEKGVGPFEIHSTDIAGKPDLVHRKSKTVIFIDGCFWHGCRKHYRKPQSRQEYWLPKIERNIARDRAITAELLAQGWQVYRIWEHALQNPRTLKWWITRITNVIKCTP
jgi:DNA mismatch endonuclease (patch repair protein)